jgi:hypothetical protein
VAQGLGFHPRAAYWFPACEFEGQIAPLRPMRIRIVLLPLNASMPASSLGDSGVRWTSRSGPCSCRLQDLGGPSRRRRLSPQ